jgi:hypothetical protein
VIPITITDGISTTYTGVISGPIPITFTGADGSDLSYVPVHMAWFFDAGIAFLFLATLVLAFYFKRVLLS